MTNVQSRSVDITILLIIALTRLAASTVIFDWNQVSHLYTELGQPPRHSGRGVVVSWTRGPVDHALNHTH